MNWYFIALPLGFLLYVVLGRYRRQDWRVVWSAEMTLWLILMSVLLALQTLVKWKAQGVQGNADITLFDFFGKSYWQPLLLAPLAEELFFRGLIFRFLFDKYRLIPAALITAILFMMGHTDFSSPLGILYAALPGGLIFGAVYVRHGLLSACLMHSLVNFLPKLSGPLLYRPEVLKSLSLEAVLCLYTLVIVLLLVLLGRAYQRMETQFPERLADLKRPASKGKAQPSVSVDWAG